MLKQESFSINHNLMTAWISKFKMDSCLIHLQKGVGSSIQEVLHLKLTSGSSSGHNVSCDARPHLEAKSHED